MMVFIIKKLVQNNCAADYEEDRKKVPDAASQGKQIKIKKLCDYNNKNETIC
jgi:hypothetical protein